MKKNWILGVVCVVLVGILVGCGSKDTPISPSEDIEPNAQIVLENIENSITESRISDIEMPNLVGKTYQEAKEILNEKNIAVESVIEQANDKYSKGVVTHQQPNAGIKVKEGFENAKLWISTGKSEIEIPNIVSLQVDLAKQKLNEKQIFYTVIEEASELPVGVVIRTDPAVGSSISTSNIVDIYVSSGLDAK